ncbi:hypothetical protein FSARC_11710 [Fusarium sarcochroum]|uniref:RNase H type-1 domain-containing protein n=1 Tax=Fusarium sarcochroum TaxID=1208366 RepID=A0A8H4TDR8_9HYPO|nr:hypothetical protein FSARC_11710 [Fusarium sarcochroum]
MLMVFQTFCANFPGIWKRELSSTGAPTARPTSSSVAAASLLVAQPRLTQRHHRQQHRQSEPPHRQGQQTTIAPLQQDLCIFIHPEVGAPLRAHSSYAIRTLIRGKLGTISDKIRQVFQVRSGWAILAADHETGDFLVEKQAEWAAELGATAVETNNDSVVSDEIEIQTGLKPVDVRTGRQFSDSPLTKTLLVSSLKPTKGRFWSLFGSRAARLIDNTDVSKQCETCWGYHFARNCHRQPRTALRQSSTSTAWAPMGPAFTGAQLDRRKCPASFAGSAKNNENTGVRSTSVHHGGLRPRKNDKKPLRVFQANVGKIPPAHDCALTLAGSERLLVDQIRPFQTRDILWIKMNGLTIVNLYRQNDEKDALSTLLRWLVPERCFVAGDFNARYRSWQKGQTTDRGQKIAGWASENDLNLLNTLDIPTNPHGNMIDLAFTNMPLAEATVEDHLTTSSDHFTLSLTIPDIKPAPLQPGKIRVTAEDELERFVEIVELRATGIPLTDSTPAEPDNLASSLVAAQLPDGQRSAPALRLHSVPSEEATRSGSIRMSRSPRETSMVCFSSSSAVFTAVRWLKSPGPFQPPLLQVDNVVLETQMDKASALRRALQERRTSDDDIGHPWTTVSPPRTIPLPPEVSRRANNITVDLLKAVWHIIGAHMRRLYERCLIAGHHPKLFKEAEVLSYISKGLERLVARRLAWATIHYNVLHSQQAGALLKRSATDLVTALIHDIEEAFARKKVVTLVTTDIQGAFDTVMRNRLVLRLREQGWPDHLAKWAESFMEDRSTRPIHQVSHPLGRFGYVDNTAILSMSDTIEEAIVMASSSIDEMIRWDTANAVSFDAKKTEVMHSSRIKLRIAPAIRRGDAEKHPESAPRWLQEEMTTLQTASKDKTAETFLRWVKPLDPLSLIMYSDGSLSEKGVASYGFTIDQANLPILDLSGHLGLAEVFDTEARGALEGLKAVLHLRESATQNIVITLDNLAAATCLRGTLSESSQDVFLEFQALAALHGSINIRWVPGHTDIPGNEEADRLAKAASSPPEPGDARLMLAYLRRIARQKPKDTFEAWLLAGAIALGHSLAPPAGSETLHGDFAAYHERFDHGDAHLVCSCRKIPPRRRMRIAPSPNAAVNLALGKDFTKFIDSYRNSSFLGKIRPRY